MYFLYSCQISILYMHKCVPVLLSVCINNWVKCPNVYWLSMNSVYTYMYIKCESVNNRSKTWLTASRDGWVILRNSFLGRGHCQSFENLRGTQPNTYMALCSCPQLSAKNIITEISTPWNSPLYGFVHVHMWPSTRTPSIMRWRLIWDKANLVALFYGSIEEPFLYLKYCFLVSRTLYLSSYSLKKLAM